MGDKLVSGSRPIVKEGKWHFVYTMLILLNCPIKIITNTPRHQFLSMGRNGR